LLLLSLSWKQAWVCNLTWPVRNKIFYVDKHVVSKRSTSFAGDSKRCSNDVFFSFVLIPPQSLLPLHNNFCFGKGSCRITLQALVGEFFPMLGILYEILLLNICACFVAAVEHKRSRHRFFDKLLPVFEPF
jgi:hypothetical protein